MGTVLVYAPMRCVSALLTIMGMSPLGSDYPLEDVSIYQLMHVNAASKIKLDLPN